jgi:hypothetical protein
MTAQVLQLRYPRTSTVVASPSASRVDLALDRSRGDVGLRGKVKDPALVRDALLTATAILKSDLRYKGKDRTAYLAHLMKQGKRATAAIWEAQKAFLEGAYADEAPRPRGLDPVLTVDPDEASLEVFSRDESAYARLSLASELFEDRAAAHGTTLAELSDAFIVEVERIRTYQPLELRAATAFDKKEELRRDVDLPDEWLRGFLQVQSAATLPAVSFSLAPIDLYDVLFVLRTRKAKKAPRGLRFELVPGARPRIAIEPWEISIEAHTEAYQGSAPRVVRVFGRQRLLALAGALPHLRSMRVHLTGPGLPSFWVLDLGLARLSVALTSWAESKWASAASFDALMPRDEAGAAGDASRRAAALLAEHGPLALAALAKLAGQTPEDARRALQRACLDGQVLFDVGRGVYRPRKLLAAPVDPARIRYGSAREAAAHRLLAGDGAAQVTKVHTIAGEGQEISGEVTDKHAQRGFLPHFTVDTEGQVRDAWCNCPTYQRSAMREGPCEHMIALFVAHKRSLADAERLRATPEGRRLVRAETRTFMRRDASGAQTEVRLSLDDRVVRVEQKDAPPGQPLAPGRHQRMWFDTDAEARADYFARLDELADKGFIDADAGAA